MAQDVISVTSASATAGINEITYDILTDAAAAGGCLAYEGLARIEVWLATTNNRGAATRAGDAFGVRGAQYKAPITGTNLTRYAWFRAVTVHGNVGNWYPSSASGGIAATARVPVPDGSIGTGQLQDEAVTDAKIASLSASKILAGIIDVLIELNSPIIRTAKTGRRIEISKDTNRVEFYNSAGLRVGSLGEDVSGEDTILDIQRNGTGSNIFVSNNTGHGIKCFGTIEVSPRAANRAAINISTQGNGIRHSAVFSTGSLGGTGIIGATSDAGGYAFYASRGTIGPFTASHPGLIKAWDGAEIGDIVIDERVLARIDLDNTVTEVAQSRAVAQKSVIGVLSKRLPEWSARDLGLPLVLSRLERDYHYAVINAVGEGQINVCGLGGDLEPGDYICSSDMPGKGQRQNRPFDDIADDLQRRCTVARVRERVTFSSPTQWKRAACIYLCG